MESVNVFKAGLVCHREDDEEAVSCPHILLPHGTELLLAGCVQHCQHGGTQMNQSTVWAFCTVLFLLSHTQNKPSYIFKFDFQWPWENKLLDVVCGNYLDTVLLKPSSQKALLQLFTHESKLTRFAVIIVQSGLRNFVIVTFSASTCSDKSLFPPLVWHLKILVTLWPNDLSLSVVLRLWLSLHKNCGTTIFRP